MPKDYYLVLGVGGLANLNKINSRTDIGCILIRMTLTREAL